MKSENGRWGTVSSAWLNHPAVGIDEFAVLSYLATFMAPDGSGIEPSQGEIARRLKISRSKVIRIIAHLSDIGILVKQRRYQTGIGELACRYRIQIDADGAVADPDIALPSVLRQAFADRAEPVTHPDAPLSQNATPRVSVCDTNQDSKIHIPTPECGRGHIGRIAEEGQGRAGAGPADPDPTVVDERWVPTSTDIAWASEHCPGLDILRHTQQYITGCRAKHRAYHDHSAAWRSWALKDWTQKDGTLPKSAKAGPEGADRGNRSPRADRRDAAASSLLAKNADAAAACLDRINRRRSAAS
jgi:hypothetical protein